MTRKLSVAGRGFTLDGKSFDMWGIRLANALETDVVAAEALMHLNSYLDYGINAFSVFLQGGSTGSANPFDADGSFTRDTRREECSETFKGRGDLEDIAVLNAHLDRLAALIEHADSLGMVVNVGIFYQARIHQLTDGAAVIRATRNTARWLVGKGYRNVFMDLVNEYGHGGFEGVGLCFGRAGRFAPDGGEELIAAFKEVAPEIPVSISIDGPEVIGFANADLVLPHRPFGPDEVRARIGRDVPVVLNEWGFGDVGVKCDELNGLYSKEDRQKWIDTIETMRAGGGFVFYHSAWKQHFTERGGPHFEIGPEGAQPQSSHTGVPSDHWYFEMVRQIRASVDEVERRTME